MRRRWVVIIFVVVGLLAVAAPVGMIWDRRLRVDAKQRERYIIAVRFLASEWQLEGDPEHPANLEELLEETGGLDSSLLKPFPNGLTFTRTLDSFQLGEPAPSRVSLFQRDRLVSTDKLWPRWEKSQVLAKKFEGQVVPPR